MRFELEPDNVGQPDEVLIADLRRVADMVRPNPITKDRYNEHGRWCAATMRGRFGNWNAALLKAGIQPTKLMNIGPEECLQDMRAVAARLGSSTLTLEQYRARGTFSAGPAARLFGDWNGALRAAGFDVSHEEVKGDEECFEAIEAVRQQKGRQPRRDEVRKPEVNVSGQAIRKRFGSWRKALEAFVAYVNDPVANDSGTKESASTSVPTPSENAAAVRWHETPRIAGWRLRFLVMRRDNFRCCKCGRSPATDLKTILVIDHVKAWANGGETTYENLRTLCEECNGGRGALKDE